MSRAAVPCGTGKLPLPWLGLADVLHSVSRIVFSRHSTRGWAELFPASDLSSPTRSGPTLRQGAGRESNLLSHVLHHGSRVCLRMSQKDRRGVGQRLYGALPLSYGATVFESRRWESNLQPPGYEPCTPTGSRSVFNGRRGSGQRAFQYGNRTRRPGCPRPQTHWTEPMYSSLQSPLSFLSSKKAQRSCCRDVHSHCGCSPGRQLGFLSRASNEEKGSDGSS